MKDYYSILGITKNATESEIKTAYRKLAKKHHPDRGGNTTKFQEIQEAYSVLSDPKKRQQYDNPKRSGVQYGDFGDFGGIDPQDIFDMFGVHVHQHRRPRRKSSVTMSLWIDLEDIAKQEKKIISVNDGNNNEHVEIQVPPAIDDGSSVRYPKLINNERDLIVQFRVKENSKWSRENLDIFTEASVNIWDLILGTSIVVDTIHGSHIKLTIPENTQPQTVMRISKHGLTDRSNKVGDMYVKINAYIPKDIPEQLREIIQNHRDSNC